MQNLEGEFVHLVGQVKYFQSLVLDQFRLRQAVDAFYAVTAGIVNVFLVFLHAADILFDRHQLLLTGRIKHNQRLQQLLVEAELVVNTPLKLQAEAFKEIFIFFPLLV